MRRVLIAAASATLALLAGWVGVEVRAAWVRAELKAPAPTVRVLDRQGRLLTEVGAAEDGGLGYWPLDPVPVRAAAATLALEDRRFASHLGVDLRAVARALFQNLRHGERVSGASTLAMQVARMQDPGPRTYLKKAREGLTAAFLTYRHGRRAILAHYLRIAPYGNRTHGLRFAAGHYFAKPVEDLSWAETALLVALPQAPSLMDPYDLRGRRRAVRRGRQILDLMREQQRIGPEQYALAYEQIERVRLVSREPRPEAALHAILQLESRLSDPEVRRRLERRPILRAHLDLDVQARTERQAAAAVRRWASRGAGNAAVVVLERESLGVTAWVGSTGYFDDRHAGAIDYVVVPRSPGSALKPFLYALALENEVITPTTLLDDLRRGPAAIENADHRFLGPLLPRVALANSRNVPAVRLVEQVGLGASMDVLGDLGLHDRAHAGDHYGLGIAVGTLPVTLERLVRAYGALAGDGHLREPAWWEGQDLPAPRRVYSEETARLLASFLSDPLARLPSFPRMGFTEYPFPVATKTGTSQGWRDAWNVAWSERWIVGVWVGHPDVRSMQGLGGYNSAAVLAQRVLLGLHEDDRDGLSDHGFPPPEGHRAHRVCALTGLRATAACDRVFVEWLRPGTEPVHDCDAHRRLAVDVRDGRLATAETPPDYVEERTFVNAAPRYASWAAGQGLPRAPTEVSRLASGSGLHPAEPLPTAEPVTFGPAAAVGTGTQTDAGLAGVVAGPPLGPRYAAAPDLRVVAPADGLSVLRDPETPAALATLAFEVVVDPPVPQVVWYVDGAPFALVEAPYVVRWPLTPGEHVVQARVPQLGAASAPVRVRVY